MSQKHRYFTATILISLLVIFSLSGCEKESDIENDLIVGEWDITGILVGIFQEPDSEVDILETLCEENGSMRFDKDHDGVFKSDCMPSMRIPTKFDWELNDDTLLMTFFGYEIKPLFQLIETEPNDQLNLFFSTDSLGVLNDQDTVLQIRMLRKI